MVRYLFVVLLLVVGLAGCTKYSPGNAKPKEYSQLSAEDREAHDLAQEIRNGETDFSEIEPEDLGKSLIRFPAKGGDK